MTWTKDKRKEYNKKYYIDNKERNKKYRQENKEQIKERNKKHRENNKKYYKEYNKKYREENEVKISERMKKYRKKYCKDNKEKIIQDRKKYYQSNKKWFKENAKKYIKERREKDTNFRIRVYLRTRIWFALQHYTKKGKTMSSKKYGVDYQAIIEHLKPFPENIKEYHIDHIKPLCGFTFIDEEGNTDLEEVKKAFAPENHQWLTIKENLSKGGKYSNQKV